MVIWRLCESIVHVLGLPLPGGVLGMVVVLALLWSGRLEIGWLRRGMSSLLDHMVLFFVPAMMGVLHHRELFGAMGLKILAVIVINALAVMMTTFVAVEIVLIRRKKW